MREDAAPRAPDPSALLAWYDRHARVLPWRVGPSARKAGAEPDPYRVWLSEIMLQQTTVAAVTGYFTAFTARWPDVTALAAAEDADVMAAWAGLGYYARARNLLKCARTVAAAGGQFPRTEDALRTLPGVGPYTAAAIAAIAFDRPATVVDGNVERVMARVHHVTAPLPGAKKALTAHAAALTPAERPGDYAQAVMDLGATICTPRNPACGLCPWHASCRARDAGDQAQLPAKAPKVAKPIRRGQAYVARRDGDGAWLLERRPPGGLLGGMEGWPGPPWQEAPAISPGPGPDVVPRSGPRSALGTDPETASGLAPPLDAHWQARPGEVRHTFTHFHLRLAVYYAEVPAATPAPAGCHWAPCDFDPARLPTVMRKVHALARG